MNRSWPLLAALILAGCVGQNPQKIASEAANKTDAGICSRISDYRMRYECTMNVAVKENDTSVCGLIESDDWRSDCLSAIASKTRNLSVCDGVRSETKKEDCLRSYAKGPART